MTESESLPPPGAGTPPVLRVKLVGVGGSACRTVARLCREKQIDAECVAVDTSAADLAGAAASGVRTLLIGENVAGGAGAGADAARGALAARASDEALRSMLAGTDLLILVASLGRGTGSGAAVEIANLAREAGLLCVCFATTPFSWEGTASTKQASEAADALQANCGAFILLENNLLAQTEDAGASYSEGFRISDRWLETGISACCRMLRNDAGRMRVDFAAFRGLFPVVGMRTLFSVGFGDGAAAQEDALTDLFRCPLLKTRTSAAGPSETLAVHIGLGAEPQISFINEIVQRVKDRFGGDSRTFPSYAVDPALGSRIELCVFGATGKREASRVVHPSPRTAPPPSRESGMLVLSPDDVGADAVPADDELDIPDSRGVFGSLRSALFEGLDLDKPTYFRKQINLERELEKKKKALGLSGAK